jgi:hypothetical protein
VPPGQTRLSPCQIHGFAEGTHLSAGKKKTLTRLQAVGCDIQHVYAAELLRDAERGGLLRLADLSAMGNVLF